MSKTMLTHEICSALRIRAPSPSALRKTLSRLYAKGFPRPFSRGRWRGEQVEAFLRGEPTSPATPPDASNDDGEDVVSQRRRDRLERMKAKS